MHDYDKSEIRVLGYYEAQGQPLATHVAWLRDQVQDIKTVVLPHDGRTHDKVYSVSYESALRDAGFNTVVVPNQGTGAAGARVEAVRRILPNCWFNKTPTRAGVECLRNYRRVFNEKLNVFQEKPLHDWSSHASDAFRYLALGLDGATIARTDWAKPYETTYDNESYKSQYL